MKYRMLADWDEEGKRGPKKGDLLDFKAAREIYDEYAEIEWWVVPYEGEFYEIYPYEIEEVK